MEANPSLPRSPRAWARFLTASAGLLIFLLGGVITVGWHAGIRAIVELQTGLPAVQYLTAACFLSAGAGLFLYALRFSRWAAILGGAFCLFVSTAFLTEYAVGSTELSQLLGAHVPPIPGLNAQLPSPPTGLAFFLCGAGMVCLGSLSAHRRSVIWISGSLALTLGIMVLGGYASGLSSIYIWGGAIGMAPQTAAGIIVLSIGLLSTQWWEKRRILDDIWLPLPAALGVAAATLIFWQALLAERQKALQSHAAVIAEDLATDSIIRLNGPIRALERMKNRWEVRNGTPQSEWNADAEAYIEDEKIFAAIEWAGPDWRIQWVRPAAEEPVLHGFDLRDDRRWDIQPALDQAKQTRALVVSPRIPLKQGGEGFLIYIPLFPNGQFDGFLIAAIRLQDFIETTLDEPIFADYSIAIFEGDKALTGSASLPSGFQPQSESRAKFHGHSWRFVVAPKVTATGDGLPSVVLTLGLLLAGMVAATVRTYQQTIWRSRETRKANEHLRHATELIEKRNTQLQAATARAEAHARAKAEFLANMSHEIRTPLNAVIGMSELLMDSRLNDRDREFVETIHSSGDVLLSLINDILDFSKIESGQLDLESIPIVLRECAESSLDLVSAAAAKKRLDLVYWIDPAVPKAILSDPTRLRQVLVNLVANAIKFTERGEVFVKLTLAPGGDLPRLHVSVRDSGIGIPEERQDRLFQAFSQVDASTTRHYGGTGLGLAISHRIVEKMGGRIWVESKVGHGSTFQFEIPAQPVDVPEPAAIGESGLQSLEGLRVLVVDDNETNRTILRMQVEMWGMHCSAVSGAEPALAQIDAGEHFDLAILDVQMPDVDGYTLAGHIRLRRPVETLPLLMLTSVGDQPGDLRALGISGFLTKPVKAAPLFNAVCRLLTHTKQVPQGGSEQLENFAQSHPLRVLIAEDNTVNQRVITLLLRRLGYEASVVANGLEVLAALEQEKFDVILLDIQMPEMDGLEAARKICRRHANAERPWMIALTAHALEGDKDDCLAAGMEDYLSKPIRTGNLEAALERAYTRSRNKKQKADSPLH